MGRPASSCATAVARSTACSKKSPVAPVTANASRSRVPARHGLEADRSVVTQSSAPGAGRRSPRRPLMGLVTASSDAALVGTITSDGTDVSEMPSSAAAGGGEAHGGGAGEIGGAGAAGVVGAVGAGTLVDEAMVGIVVVATVATGNEAGAIVGV